MLKKILALLSVALMLMGCAFGTPVLLMTPRCQFDSQLLIQSPDSLPAATGGSIDVLLANRIDSKLAYQSLYIKHRDLSAQARNCIATQRTIKPYSKEADHE